MINSSDVIEMQEMGMDLVKQKLFVLFDPTGSHFVVVIKRASIASNSNTETLLMYKSERMEDTAEPPKTLVSLSSRSNEPPIRQIKWAPDGHAIYFIGTNMNDSSQVYRVDVRTLKLTRMTSSASSVTAYDVSFGKRGQVIFAADERLVESRAIRDMRLNGFTVTDQRPEQLISADWAKTHHARLFIQDSEQVVGRAAGLVGVKSIGDCLIPPVYDLTQDPVLQFSPDGRYAIAICRPSERPGEWQHYLRPHMVDLADRVMLIDPLEVSMSSLWDTPVGEGEGIVWAGDATTVILTGSYSPAEDMQHRVIAVDIKSRAWREIPVRGPVLVWDNSLDALEAESDRSGHPLATDVYRRGDGGWSRQNIDIPAGMEKDPKHRFEVFATGNMEYGGTISIRELASAAVRPLITLNTNLSKRVASSTKRLEWTSKDGSVCSGTLYLPYGFIAGKKYPLVIQKQGRADDPPYLDGPYHGAFAAQALATIGIAVLQVPEWAENDNSNHIDEGPLETASIEGAIDQLAAQGLVDPQRVGLIGFSRTGYQVLYSITHSRYHFAAATVDDSVNFGYMEYFVDAPFSMDLKEEFEDHKYGGGPFGSHWKAWLERSPIFGLNKVKTPIRFEAHGPSSVLGTWDAYETMRMLGEPAELMYFPEGEHQLVRPLERLNSQQGDVEWFAFWLLGREHASSTNRTEYERWHTLRSVAEPTVP
ncbi:MAG: hypothetical protein WCC21_18395 [Candidatus Acidiferrales bacterium]